MLYRIILLMLFSHAAFAGEVKAAVAANFAAPAKQIAALFEKETGNRVSLSTGATGKFYAQIREGAPFDVLLAADEDTPELLEQQGLAVAGSSFVYALGKLVLWSSTTGYADGSDSLKAAGRIAIADPKLAPYGRAAMEALQNMGLMQKVGSRVVTGESIGQTYQFAASGNARLAFIALSQIMQDGRVSKGSWWLVPESLYRPIRQAAVELASAKDRKAAAAFLTFLKGPEAAAIIRSYGYGMP